QVLYGPVARRRRDDLLNETALVDAEQAPQRLNRKQKDQRFVDTFASRYGRTAHPILPSGDVIWPARSGGRPAADHFWAARDLFKHANRCFAVYGKETPVSFDATADAPAPDIMHWTVT